MDTWQPDDDLRAHYIDMRQLPDGRWIGLHRLMFHYTIHVDISYMSFEERWCIQTLEQATEAFNKWDGESEPLYWHKHYPSMRRRDKTTLIEYERDI